MSGPWHWSTIFSKQVRVSSQNGEDGVLLYLLWLIEHDSPRKAKLPRSCFEVGASLVNGNLECNTAVLLNNGWNGVVIDREEIIHPLCRQQVVTSDNICQVVVRSFPEAEDLERISVFSLDIDGMDWWVWKALPLTPAVYIVECNAHRDPQARETVAFDPDFRWDGSDYFGASAGAMLDLGHAKGCKLTCVTSCLNMFFVRDDLLPPGFEEYPLDLVGPIRRHPTNKTGRWVSTKETT